MLILFMVAGTQLLRAEEGMWIPLLIEKYQIGPMKEAGLRLDAEDIYSINQACLKDAVAIFGSGCTGEMISGDGLILTNHHCGEGMIQWHSSVEHDYLTDGFWAMSREEELPNEGLTVTFLRQMEDVTDAVNQGLVQGMDPDDRQRRINLNRGELIREATEGTHYDAEVKPFYYGNAYYLFVYEKFRDVRLVGAPPVSIGSFGGDTDNWMWPRHSADFSLFRVYAGEENKPAGYSPDNQPYQPGKHLEISAAGIEEGDFTMVLGFPASTTMYLHPEAIRAMVETSLPLKIALRSARLEVMERYMETSDVVRIQYAHKQSRVSNAWKKWQGVILGLKRNHIFDKKVADEAAFLEWMNEDGERQMKYDHLPEDFAQLYREKEQSAVAVDLMSEAINPLELFGEVNRVLGMMQLGRSSEEIENQVAQFFKDFHMPVDRDIFAAMMQAYHDHMPEALYPPFFTRVEKRDRGDFSSYAETLYRKAVFGEREGARKLLETYKRSPEKALKRLRKDPALICLNQFKELYYREIYHGVINVQEKEAKLYKTYMAGLLEMSGERPLYADANRTMRLTYGKVKGYRPMDGVEYRATTSLSGLLEKYKKGNVDYAVPEKLVELYENRDYGRYGVNGTMPVCFIATNHTSGGNSGSPVLDAEGRLVGLNFDREWEGTMSDVFYDPNLCRNIAVDIRYVLFIIDKYAGAGYLLDEMEIIF